MQDEYFAIAKDMILLCPESVSDAHITNPDIATGDTFGRDLLSLFSRLLWAIGLSARRSRRDIPIAGASLFQFLFALIGSMFAPLSASQPLSASSMPAAISSNRMSAPSRSQAARASGEPPSGCPQHRRLRGFWCSNRFLTARYIRFFDAPFAPAEC